jgi:hypothetical protein
VRPLWCACGLGCGNAGDAGGCGEVGDMDCKSGSGNRNSNLLPKYTATHVPQVPAANKQRWSVHSGGPMRRRFRDERPVRFRVLYLQAGIFPPLQNDLAAEIMDGVLARRLVSRTVYGSSITIIRSIFTSSLGLYSTRARASDWDQEWHGNFPLRGGETHAATPSGVRMRRDIWHPSIRAFSRIAIGSAAIGTTACPHSL